MQNHRADLARRWSASPAQVFPSLLNCDFSTLADEIAVAERCGVEAVHWDVMDGDFVPNLSYGAMVVKDCRPASSIYFDAHLMIRRPEKYLDGFLDAGCDGVTFHLEVAPDPSALLGRIRAAGRLAGLAINPGTPVESLQPWLDQVDLVNVMSVEPGFGGQKFLPSALGKLEWLRTHAPSVLLQVDGGVNSTTAADVVAAGARLLVVGSAFYGAADRAAALADLRGVIAQS